jgi:AcrR family transcriptional regulator
MPTEHPNGQAGEARQTYDQKLEFVLQRAAEVFAERGYHQASMRDVARAAGMSVAGPYYCKSREELLFRLAVRFRVILQRQDAGLADAADPEEKLRRPTRIHLDYFLKNMAEMKVVSHEAGSLTGRHMAEAAEVKR